MDEKLLQEVVNELEGMKLLANEGPLDYYNDRLGYANLVLKTSNKFKNYLSNVMNNIKTKQQVRQDLYNSSQVSDFLQGLKSIINEYGYNLSSENNNSIYYFKPLKDIETIIDNYRDNLDISKLKRKTLNMHTPITAKDLIDKDAFINDDIKNKFLNAVFAMYDTIKYLYNFVDNQAEKSDKSTFLSGLFYAFDFYPPAISRILSSKSPIDMSFVDYGYSFPSYIKKTKITEVEPSTTDIEKFNIVNQYIINRFKDVVEHYLPSYKSLQNVTFIKSIEPGEISIQLEAMYNKDKLEKINDVLYKYL